MTKKEEPKVGERWLIRHSGFTVCFHGHVVAIKDGWFGKKYIMRYTENHLDFGYRNEVSSFFPRRRLIVKD